MRQRRREAGAEQRAGSTPSPPPSPEKPEAPSATNAAHTARSFSFALLAGVALRLSGVVLLVFWPDAGRQLAQRPELTSPVTAAWRCMFVEMCIVPESTTSPLNTDNTPSLGPVREAVALYGDGHPLYASDLYHDVVAAWGWEAGGGSGQFR